MNGRDPGLPIENFIQALTSQLDRAQAAMALKARAGLALTFAVKDLTMDLRAHLEMVGSVVHIRSAGPGESEASTIRLALTTITRPMIEENAPPAPEAPDEPSLREVLGPEVSEDDRRRLEWAGIHNVTQLREVQRRSGEEALERSTQVPVARLRAALFRAAMPRIVEVKPEPAPPANGNGGGRIPHDRLGVLTIPPGLKFSAVDAPLPAGGTSVKVAPPLLKIRGINLLRGADPKVTIGGEAVPVIRASERELLVAPHAHLLSGTLAVEVEPGVFTETELQLPQLAEEKGATP